ncbi:unnamed protein product, partial [Ixodes hexagonus]
MSSATAVADEGEGAPEESRGIARLEFSEEGVPALVDSEVVLDNPALVEFFAHAVASYGIPGQDSIQPGTLVQIDSNTILAVASVDSSGPTQEEIIEAASNVMLPSAEEQAATDESRQPETIITAASVEDVPTSTSTDAAEEAAPSEQTAATVAIPDGIHIAQGMTEMDFSNFLSGNEEAGSGLAPTVVVKSEDLEEPLEQTEHRVLHVTLTADDVQQHSHVAIVQEEEPSAEPPRNIGHEVTDVIQRALLGGDEDEEVIPSSTGDAVEGAHERSGPNIEGTDAADSADPSIMDETA